MRGEGHRPSAIYDSLVCYFDNLSVFVVGHHEMCSNKVQTNRRRKKEEGKKKTRDKPVSLPVGKHVGSLGGESHHGSPERTHDIADVIACVMNGGGHSGGGVVTRGGNRRAVGGAAGGAVGGAVGGAMCNESGRAETRTSQPIGIGAQGSRRRAGRKI